MKKAIFFVFAIILLAGLASAQITTTTSVINPSGIDLKIILNSQEPDPVEPGNYVDLRFKIENWGTRAAEQTVVELLPVYPFSLEPGASAEKSIGKIEGLLLGQNAVVVKYRVKVDGNAGEGENSIRLRYKTSSYDWITSDQFNVSVQSKNILVGIDSVSLEPPQLLPGKIANISIGLNNFAKSFAKDISIKMDFTDLPLAPVGSADTIISMLEPGKEIDANFTIAANSDAETKIYRIPVSISYFDRTGKNYTKNYFIGLNVGGKPEIVMIPEDSGFLEKGKTFTFGIQVINKGPIKAKFVTIGLAPSEGYKILSPDRIYIGDLDSDDFQTAEFKLYITKEDNIQLPLTVTYSDPNNAQYEEGETLNAKVYSPSELKSLGLGGRNYTGILITIAIIVLGLFAYLRLRRKKK